MVSVVDIMRVAAQWGAQGLNIPEDVDGNQIVDIADVQQVAGQWRETCHVLAETVKDYALGGRRIAMRKVPAGQAGTLHYLLTDHLGSTSVSYRSDGGDTRTQRYYPWGTIRPGPANTLPTDYTFTGQKLDADTGLMYYSDGAGYGRYYEPLLGRFSQPDTLVPNPGDPQQLNRYSYAANNPLRYADPTGHWAGDALGHCQHHRGHPHDPRRGADLGERSGADGGCGDGDSSRRAGLRRGGQQGREGGEDRYPLGRGGRCSARRRPA